MADSKRELLQGTLDLLILKTLATESLHGWGVARRIQQASGDVLRINQGSLYPALYRLQDKGLIRGRWGESVDGRRVKLYSLTAAGKKRFGTATQDWRSVSAAVNDVLSMT